jgi:hypothetical protein
VSDAQIVSVDRRAVSTLTLATLRQLLKADDGRVVLMETSRAGAMRTVALRLRRLV